MASTKYNISKIENITESSTIKLPQADEQIFLHYREMPNLEESYYICVGYLYFEFLILKGAQCLKDFTAFYAREESDPINSEYNSLISPVLSCVTQLYSIRSTQKPEALEDSLYTFHRMACSRIFGKSLIRLLRFLISEFLNKNEDLEIDSYSIRMLIESEGKTLDNYIADNVLSKHAPPTELVLKLLPLILRISIDTIQWTNNSPAPFSKSSYPAELPSFKTEINDSLNFHKERLTLYRHGNQFNYCLYNSKDCKEYQKLVDISPRSRYISVMLSYYFLY